MIATRVRFQYSCILFITLLCALPGRCSAQQQGLISPAAQAAAAARDFKPAIAELSDLIARDPANIAALTNRASLYQKAGMPDKSLSDAQTAIGKNGRNYNAYFIAGASLIQLQQPERAIRYFDTALVVKPGWLQALQFRGKLLVQTGQYDAAIADLTRVTELAPDGAEAYLLRARAYTRKYRNEEAIRDYITVTNLAPKGSKVYELAKEEIQAPAREYEELKAAMNAPARPAAEDDARKKAVQIRKELWDTLQHLSLAIIEPSLEMSLARKERDRAAFDKARKAVLASLQLKEAAFAKAALALKEISTAEDPQQTRALEQAHSDNLALIRDFTDAPF